MNARKPTHKLVVAPEGKRLRGTCSCGRWVRTTPNDQGAKDRLKARFVDHVTGSHRL